jgi:hypothetical protein
MSEKERLLTVATPEEWRKWIEQKLIRTGTCLFCQAYKTGPYTKDCESCCPREDFNERFPGMRCRQGRTEAEMIEIAIARLEAAGIWED